MQTAKVADLAPAVGPKWGGRFCLRVPVIGANCGPYRAELLLTLAPSDFLESSFMVWASRVDERILGVNYKESYPDPEDATRFRCGWHEHRWEPVIGTRNHYPVPHLDTCASFGAVLEWVEETWHLEIIGFESLPRTLLGG
jgi:hypothetical protein